MAKRVNRQLKKQLEEQKNLEEELDKLQNGKDPKESCAEVIKFVGSTSMDPMPDTGVLDKLGNYKAIEELKIGDAIMCMIPTHASFKESIDCEIKDIPKLFSDAIVSAIHKSFTNYICSIKYRNLNT
ncbi:hypothetical protein RFI_31885, partial [Reticulomyxa filosa]